MTDSFRYSPFAMLALLLALFLFGGKAIAEAAPSLVLSEVGEQGLGGHFSLFPDPSGALDLAAVRRADTGGMFRPQPAPATNLGYVRGAFWLRTVLHNPQATAQTRWLRQSFAIQQSAILFVVHGDGRISRMDNGMQVAIPARDLPMREILFPLHLEAGESVTLYLRLSGSSVTKAHLTLWQPAAYVDARLRDTAIKYLVLGSTLIVAVFSILAWEARRRPGLLFGVPASILILFILFFIDGLALDWFPLGPDLWPYRLRGLLIFLTLACEVLFASAFLDLPKHFPRLARALRWLALLALVLAPLSAFSIGAIQVLHYLVLFIVAVLMGVALLASWRGTPFARLYLLAWGCIWGSLVLRSLSDFGLFPALPPEPDLVLLGYVACSLTLSVALYLDIRKVRADAEATHYRFLRHQLDEKQRLADAVTAKTRELREAKALAEEASHAKTTFLSEVSHELRAPLHTMLGYAQLLDRQATGEMAAKLGIISKSGAQLVRLIDDVLAYSRGEVKAIELDLEPLSLPALVAQLEQGARLQAEQRGNRFQVTLAPGLPTAVRADEQRLAQVLQNLISNACKFTQDGDIRLSIAPLANPAVAWGGATRLRFMVEDSGIGIAEEDQERVFTPFYRIRNAQRRPGIGLGLAIARQLVRAMGGDIVLDSAPGRGSRFSFTLVLQTTQLEANATKDLAVHLIHGHQGRQRMLLIVDDIADNRNFMRQLCGDWGFASVVAGDGHEALAACDSAQPPIDAVLVDQYMPGADGWDFLRAIRETPTHAQLPVILISAAPAARPADFPADMDFDGVLMKPLQTAALAQLLARFLDLEWILQVPVTEPVAEMRCASLSQADAAQLRDAMALGKVLDLQRQAETLAQRNPECSVFAMEIMRLCELVDLPGLQRLFALVLPGEGDNPRRG